MIAVEGDFVKEVPLHRAPSFQELSKKDMT